MSQAINHPRYARFFRNLPLIAALLLALALRIWLWGRLPRTGMISDEGEYLAAASWLAHGRGFAWYLDYLWTRAPLYPLFLAAHLRLFGDTTAPIYLTQTALSLVNVALVYVLARRMLPVSGRRTTSGDRHAPADDPEVNAACLAAIDEPTATGPGLSRGDAGRRRMSLPPIGSWAPALAALMMALYFPFAIYPQVLLSETLYLTLLLSGFLALARPATDDRPRDKKTRRQGDKEIHRAAVTQSSVPGPQSWAATDDRPRDKKTRRQGDKEIHRAAVTQSSVLGPQSWAATDDRRPTTDDLSPTHPLTPPPGHPVTRSPGHPVTRSPCHLVRPLPAAIAGVLFGLATLTRGLTLLFLPLVALWLAVEGRPRARGHAGEPPRTVAGSWRRMWAAWSMGLRGAAVFLVCAGVVVLPWSIYNSRLYGGSVLVDTTGAFNLLLGARTAYDGGRSDAPTRDFVLGLFPGRGTSGAARQSCAPYPGPLPSQAARQTAMIREGLCLIAARPLAFARKSLDEVVDLFQINYTGDERFTDEFTLGRLPAWYAAGLFLLDDTLYVLVLPLAVIGWALARAAGATVREPRLGRLAGLWWFFTIVVAPLLFAINRFRLPMLPFAFIFAAYALVALPGGGWRRLRSRRGAACVALAVLLAVAATAPYAYLWPADQSLPSYLGSYPSSLADTRLALVARSQYLRTERLRRALRAGDAAGAAAALESGPVMAGRAGKVVVADTATLARALLAGIEGRPSDGLRALAPLETIAAAKDVEAAVVRGDLLRSMGDLAGARASFTPVFVDSANPVQWAWDWLHPAPARRIDLGGNLDLGYVAGCYLGEGDPSGGGTFRWCTDGARLRFPGAGTGISQTLALRADGRGWPRDMLPVPPVRVFVGEREVGAFTPDQSGVREFMITLPPGPSGADVVVTLRSATFLPGAADYLGQQGAQASQPRRLGMRLDWAELRGKDEG